MKTIVLVDGDIRTLFPRDAKDPELRRHLVRANDEILNLARHIGGRAGWTGHGVEYHVHPSGQLELVAFAESDDATFWADLRPAGFFEQDAQQQGWYVSSEITVRCGHESDCGTHAVETWGQLHFSLARQAAEKFFDAVSWLLARGEAEVPGYWRAHDPLAVTPENWTRGVDPGAASPGHI